MTTHFDRVREESNGYKNYDNDPKKPTSTHGRPKNPVARNREDHTYYEGHTYTSPKHKSQKGRPNNPVKRIREERGYYDFEYTGRGREVDIKLARETERIEAIDRTVDSAYSVLNQIKNGGYAQVFASTTEVFDQLTPQMYKHFNDNPFQTIYTAPTEFQDIQRVNNFHPHDFKHFSPKEVSLVDLSFICNEAQYKNHPDVALPHPGKKPEKPKKGNKEKQKAYQRDNDHFLRQMKIYENESRALYAQDLVTNAMNLIELGNTAGASMDLCKAQALDPLNPNIHIAIAKQAINVGNTGTAKIHLDKAHDMQVKEPPTEKEKTFVKEFLKGLVHQEPRYSFDLATGYTAKKTIDTSQDLAFDINYNPFSEYPNFEKEFANTCVEVAHDLDIEDPEKLAWMLNQPLTSIPYMNTQLMQKLNGAMDKAILAMISAGLELGINDFKLRGLALQSLSNLYWKTRALLDPECFIKIENEYAKSHTLDERANTLTTVEGNKSGLYSLDFVHGIDNTYEEALQSAQLLSKLFDHEATFTYKQTYGKFIDSMLVAIGNASGAKDCTQEETFARWDQKIDSGEYVIEIPHSKGSTSLNNNLKAYDKDKRKYIIAICVGPSTYISDELCGMVIHLDAKNDLIGKLDQIGRARAIKQGTIIEVEPVNGENVKDVHSFKSETYQKALEDVIPDIIEFIEERKMNEYE